MKRSSASWSRLMSGNASVFCRIVFSLTTGTSSSGRTEDGQVTDFFRRLAHTHAVRWRIAHRSVGYGHLYQGRFKSFPVQSDDHLLGLLRYVERSPVAAGLVERAQQWRWGSLWSRTRGPAEIKALLSPWPVERPSELDGSRQHALDREGIRPRAGKHRERTTLRRRRVGPADGQEPRTGADRPSRRPPAQASQSATDEAINGTAQE